MKYFNKYTLSILSMLLVFTANLRAVEELGLYNQAIAKQQFIENQATAMNVDAKTLKLIAPNVVAFKTHQEIADDVVVRQEHARRMKTTPNKVKLLPDGFATLKTDQEFEDDECKRIEKNVKLYKEEVLKVFERLGVEGYCLHVASVAKELLTPTNETFKNDRKYEFCLAKSMLKLKEKDPSLSVTYKDLQAYDRLNNGINTAVEGLNCSHLLTETDFIVEAIYMAPEEIRTAIRKFHKDGVYK